MAFKAMTQPSDSQNPAAPDMPLYAIVKNGQFYLLAVEDIPCPTLTPDALEELANPDRLPMDALPHIQIGRSATDQAYIDELALTPEDKEARLIASLKRNGIDTSWMDEVSS